MSREIKFRAYGHIEGNDPYKMYYGVCVDHVGIPTYVGSPVCDHSLMQYTGLKDKNGIEIYEGDVVSGKSIISISPNEIIIGTVFYQNNTGCWEISVKRNDYEDIDFLYSVLQDKRHELEVIGNIHETPELLNA